MTTARYSTLTLYRRLLRQARPYYTHIVGILLLSLLATPLALLTPLPLKIAVDTGLGSQLVPGFLEVLLPAAVTRSDSAVLALVVGLTVGIALVSKLQELASSLVQNYAGEKLALDFRVQLFRHVQRLSLSYQDAKGTSNSIYRIQSDASAIRYIAIDGIIPFFTASVTLLSTLYIIFQLDWQLTLVALTVSPVLFLLSQTYRRCFRRQWREIKQIESSALSVIQEALAAVRVVKA